jgi:hypothetical protein
MPEGIRYLGLEFVKPGSRPNRRAQVGIVAGCKVCVAKVERCFANTLGCLSRAWKFPALVSTRWRTEPPERATGSSLWTARLRIPEISLNGAYGGKTGPQSVHSVPKRSGKLVDVGCVVMLCCLEISIIPIAEVGEHEANM